MAVVNKSRTVRITSSCVGIACHKNNPNYYDLVLPWDVRITFSGTFLHYSTADPYPGNGNASHGCVHLSYANARWYYHLSNEGDPVMITGAPRRKASGDNGYADMTCRGACGWRQRQEAVHHPHVSSGAPRGDSDPPWHGSRSRPGGP